MKQYLITSLAGNDLANDLTTMEEKKAKFLGHFNFKSVSKHGTLCKTYVNIYEDGVTEMNQVFLSKTHLENMTCIYKKCGYGLYVVAIAFQWPSLQRIHNTVDRCLALNMVPGSKIVGKIIEKKPARK